MEAEARYTYVGAAVLLLVGALLASLLWLATAGGGDFKRFAIHFESQALDGLQVGAEVNLRGIKIGRVVDYALARDTLNRVRVEVAIDPRVTVRSSTVAVVTRNFVTGIASIALVNREPAGELLVRDDKLDVLPVIGEGQSNLDELTGRVSQVGEQVTQALVSLNQLLTDENRQNVMATVSNLRDLSSGLNQRLASLDRLMASAGRLMADAGRATGQVGDAATQLAGAGARVTAVAERSSLQFDQTLQQTERTLRDASAAMAQVAGALDRMERQAGSTARRLEGTATQVEDQLGAATAELRLSMEAATRVLDRLRDPRAAILGPGPRQFGPGETKP